MARWNGSVLILGLVILIVACGPESPPSREQIPVLRGRLYSLEQGLKSQDRAALDSLLSVEILDVSQDSDSLLKFVYGPEGTYPFFRLGDYSIFYTDDLAVIDCYIMDSSQNHERPLKLRYRHHDTLWLLKKFEPGEPAPDTATAEW